MMPSSVKSRGTIVSILLVAFCLTTTLWVSYQRAMTVKPVVKPPPESLASQKLQGHAVEAKHRRIRANLRDAQSVRERRTTAVLNGDSAEGAQPLFQAPSHYSTAGVTLAPVTPPNTTAIALVDLREITIAYQKQNGYLPTNSITEWKSYIQSVQLIVSNRAVAEGYTLVLDKAAQSAAATPLCFIAGEIPDITAQVIKDMNAVKGVTSAIP